MIHGALITIQVVLLATVGFLVAYLFLLSVFAALGRGDVNVKPTVDRRFAVVIPAHDEEFTIVPTIQSALQMNYPRELFEVLVIADNCTDQTAVVSKAQGATVLERHNTEFRGKGYALRWCTDLLLEGQVAYDAFVFVDADSTLSANFLGIMNSYLDTGAQVLQSSDLVKPTPGAWSPEMTRLGFTLYNYARPLGRRLLGCSAGLRGNGMCFTAGVLRAFPWNAYSRNEDLEFGLHLLLQGIPTLFAPEAMVLATMPSSAQLTESQRARWEGGRFPVIREFAPALLRKSLSTFNLKYFDALIDLITPALVNLQALTIAVGLLTAGLYLAGVQSMLSFLYIWIGVLFLGLLHLFLGLYAARADRSLYRILFQLPRYALWKVLLYLKLTRSSKTPEWIRTTRETAVASGDVRK